LKKGIKLDRQTLEYAVMGGCILGGGGGGDMTKGLAAGKVAVDYADLYLYDINEMKGSDIIVCASAVGAPKAPMQYYTPRDAVRSMELFMENSGEKVCGIISNENGGIASVNGWMQAAVLGIPLIDAPCNGRAHPTGVMGSLCLHKDHDYISLQACCGGNAEAGRYIECFFSGTVDRCATLVRAASVEAGGMVYVARNPVTAEYVKQNAAIGGLSHAIETGRVFKQGLERSPGDAVRAVADFVGGEIFAKEKVREFHIKTEGGFDVGIAKIGDMELTFWNEYMTLDSPDKRIATFPELIMTFDAISGQPLTTAQMEQGQEVYIMTAPMSAMKLSSTMYETELLQQVEGIVNKELVKHLPACKVQ